MSTYAHPEILVETAWLAEHLNDPNIRIVESDEDILLYDTGHIPGAVKIDWVSELNDPVTRDYLDSERFAKLLASKGISNDTTVVFYGDKHNWWAAYALWVFQLFGHSNVRLLNGGRNKWIAEGRELTREVPTYPPPTTSRRPATIPKSVPSNIKCLSISNNRVHSWMCVARRSIAVNVPTCPNIRKKARCAADTSPVQSISRGPKR